MYTYYVDRHVYTYYVDRHVYTYYVDRHVVYTYYVDRHVYTYCIDRHVDIFCYVSLVADDKGHQRAELPVPPVDEIGHFSHVDLIGCLVG